MIIMKKVKKMIKSLIRLFIPSSKKLATIAAEQICNAVNSSNKEEQIQQIMKYADILTDIQAKICVLLKDGKLDEEEKKQIAADLEPLIQKLIDML